jgi:hypothetical protein
MLQYDRETKTIILKTGVVLSLSNDDFLAKKLSMIEESYLQYISNYQVCDKLSGIKTDNKCKILSNFPAITLNAL